MGRDLIGRQGAIVLGAAGTILIALALFPILVVTFDLAAAPGALDAVFRQRVWSLLGRSIGIATAVTALSLVAGVPLGVVFARAELRWRRLFLALHAAPSVVPPFLLALGWFQLFGRSGWLGSEASSALLFSSLGAILVLALAFTPVLTVLTMLGLDGVDATLEEAARLVASPARTAALILVPSAYPAIALGALVVFVLAFIELGVPMFLRVEVYPAAVFARLGGIDYAPGEAAALAVPGVAVAGVLLALERALLGSRAFSVLGVRGALRDSLDFGAWNVPLRIAAVSGALLSAAPLVALGAKAASAGVKLGALWEWASVSPLVGLACSLAAATTITLLGIVIGHAAARLDPIGRASDGIALLAFLLPSAVLGAGMIQIWNRPLLGALYATPAIVSIGFIAKYSAIGVRAFGAAVTQTGPSFEEAARAAGASYLRRLFLIVLPMHRRAMLVTFMLALVFCLRDLDTAVLFYPPGGEPLTVRIFTLEANGPPAVVAGLAFFHALSILSLVALAAWIQRRWAGAPR